MTSSTRSELINIDSSFRSTGPLYNFTIDLFNEIRNISQVELVSIDIPSTTLWGINHSNNVLILALNNLMRAYVIIDAGVYTDITLASSIQLKLNNDNALGVSTWVCVFNNTSNLYTISNASGVNFYIASDGLINTTIGYNTSSQTATTTSITGDSISTLNSGNYMLVTSTTLNPHQGVPSAISYARIVHNITNDNGTILMNDTISDYTILIPNGQYNLYELATTMQLQMNAQAFSSVALPIYVEYILDINTNLLNFQFRANSTMSLGGSLIKTVINYYISANTTTSPQQIYGVPLSASTVLVINPVTGLVNNSTVTVEQTLFKWRGAAKSNMGKIYFAPFDASSVFIRNTLTGVNDTTTIPILPASDGFDTVNRWSDAITAPNGSIYFVPYHDRYWAAINPSNDTINRSVQPAFTNAAHNREVTQIITTADTGGGLGGTYFTINTTTTAYYAWISINGAGTIDPNPGGTGIVIPIAINSTSTQVASAIRSTFDSLPDFTSVLSSLGHTIIYNVVNGDVPTSTNINTPFTITRIGIGIGVAEFRTVATIADVSGSLNNTYFTLSSPSTNYYVWFNVGGIGVDPTPGGTPIPVSIPTNASALDVALAIISPVNSTFDFNVAINATLNIANTAIGVVGQSQDVNTGFTITQSRIGTPTTSESTSITPTNASSLDGTYFTIDTPSTQYYVWFNVDGSNNDPTVLGRTGISIVLSSSDSATTVGFNIAVALDARPDLFVELPSLTITNIIGGESNPSIDFGTGFTISTTTGSGGRGVRFYSSGVLVGNNIYGVPWQIGSGFSVLDTELSTVRNVTSPLLSNEFNLPLYSDGVYVPAHNKIYCCPFFTRNDILVIDVGSNDNVSVISTPLIPTNTINAGYELYASMVLAPNGKIYCIPLSENFILVLDTATDPPTISSPVGLRGLGTVGSLYSLADLLLATSPVNSIPNARKWSTGILTPDRKIWCMPLLDTRVLIIDTLTDTVSYSPTILSPGADKWLGQILSDSYILYADSVRKSTAGHILYKAYNSEAVGGRILTTSGGTIVRNFSSGYNITSIDLQIVDAYGNYITEFIGDYSMLLRITHA